MFLFYLFISFIASIIGAISGIGGGVIIKPALDSLSPFGVSIISFLSGNTVLAMTMATLLKNRKSGVKPEGRVSTLLAAGGVAGGLGGKFLFDIIRTGFGDDKIIGASQSVILAVLTLGALLFTVYKNRMPSHQLKNPVFCLLTGVLLGGIASFLGIGGGPINLAVLSLLFSMDSKKAALSSIYIIFFSQLTNLFFTIMTGNVPSFSPIILIVMVSGGAGGGLVGSHLSIKMTHRHVDYLYGAVMAMIIGLSIYNFIHYLG